mgnify:CR=1 FL=1
MRRSERLELLDVLLRVVAPAVVVLHEVAAGREHAELDRDPLAVLVGLEWRQSRGRGDDFQELFDRLEGPPGSDVALRVGQEAAGDFGVLDDLVDHRARARRGPLIGAMGESAPSQHVAELPERAFEQVEPFVLGQRSEGPRALGELVEHALTEPFVGEDLAQEGGVIHGHLLEQLYVAHDPGHHIRQTDAQADVELLHGVLDHIADGRVLEAREKSEWHPLLRDAVDVDVAALAILLPGRTQVRFGELALGGEVVEGLRVEVAGEGVGHGDLQGRKG